MFIKRIFGFIILSAALVACQTTSTGWNSEYGTMPATRPAEMQSGFYYPELDIYGGPGELEPEISSADIKNVSVLLPMSGPNSEVGRGIGRSIEMAFLQNQYKNINVTFFDLTGNKLDKQNTIINVLASHPDIIIGPVFAEDAQMLRSMKPLEMPVLSFTSDASAVGNGVMTMALAPSQSVEAIIVEMTKDKSNGVVILAPNTDSGRLMAGAAVLSANTYDMPVAGLFYYKEGNSDSIKSVAQRASMHNARTAAHTRAREILSDIAVKETLTAAEKSSINTQLNKLSKNDTIGKLPYDAVLFLGNANDTKSLVSFLRYYDVRSRDARFYGTVLWDSSSVLNDINMSGAKFAALPAMSPDFAKLYEQASGDAPSRLDTFGFDAANLAKGMLYANIKNPNKTYAAYLLDPSGYAGLDGLFRLRPDGISERALEVKEVTGNGEIRITRTAVKDFLTPVYNVQPTRITSVSEMDLVGPGINPMNYITIPEHLRGKYNSKTFGANTRPTTSVASQTSEVVILPEDDSDIITDPDFQPISIGTVDRHLIDSVEVSE